LDKDIPDQFALGNCSDLLRIVHTLGSVEKPN
jgi:hypothetical protein